MRRDILEEIVIQGLADLEKEVHSGPLGVEDLVKVLGGAVHLLRQPHRCAALPRQLSLNQPTQMQLG